MTGLNGHAHTFDVDLHILEVNSRYAYVLENGKATIFREDRDADGHLHVTRLSVQDFKSTLSNQIVFKGDKATQLGKYWIEHPQRRTYERSGFEPDPKKQDQANFYNLFRGMPVEPRKGDWSLFQKHLLEVGCNGDDETFEFFIQWLRLLVQAPHVMPGVAIVLQGRQGSGKGCIVRWLGKLVGKHFRHVSNVRHVVGNFNSHLEDVLLLFADEAVWAGDKASEGALKALVTEPTILLERKGRDAYQVPNYTHLIIATNNDWAAPMEGSDRRFVVVNTPDTYCNNGPYFAAINRQMSEGGLEAMMFDLANGFIDTDKPLRKPRSVSSIEAAWRQKEQSLSPFHSWLQGKLEDGLMPKQETWESHVSREAAYEDYLAAMQRQNVQRRLSPNIFGRQLHQIIPGIITVRPGNFMHRQRMWKMPPLDAARAAYAKAFLMPTDAIFDAEQSED